MKQSGQSIRNRQQIEKEIAEHEAAMARIQQDQNTLTQQYTQVTEQNKTAFSERRGAIVALKKLLSPSK